MKQAGADPYCVGRSENGDENRKAMRAIGNRENSGAQSGCRYQMYCRRQVASFNKVALKQETGSTLSGPNICNR